MKTSRPSPLALLSIATLTLITCLSAGLFVVQNNDLRVQNDVENQLARVGIEGEEIPVPFA